MSKHIVSALTLCAYGDNENLKPCMLRVLDGGTTTASGDNRKSGMVCALLREKMNARPDRESSKISPGTLSECGATLR